MENFIESRIHLHGPQNDRSSEFHAFSAFGTRETTGSSVCGQSSEAVACQVGNGQNGDGAYFELGGLFLQSVFLAVASVSRFPSITGDRTVCAAFQQESAEL